VGVRANMELMSREPHAAKFVELNGCYRKCIDSNSGEYAFKMSSGSQVSLRYSELIH